MVRALPPAQDWLTRRVRALEQSVKQLQGARTLENASIGAGGSGLTVLDDDENELLTLGASGLTATPAGRIGDDALAHPSQFGRGFADNNSTNLPVAGSYFATGSLTVPADYSQALITCYATVGYSRQAGAGGAPFYVAAWIGAPDQATATGSAEIATTVADGAAQSITAVWARALTGLTAGTVIQGGAWGAVDSTTGWLSGSADGHTVLSATFLR